MADKKVSDMNELLSSPSEEDIIPILDVSETDVDKINSRVTVDQLTGHKANKHSPTFTGAPKAPTPGGFNNNNKLATTEFTRKLLDKEKSIIGFIEEVEDKYYIIDLSTRDKLYITSFTTQAKSGSCTVNLSINGTYYYTSYVSSTYQTTHGYFLADKYSNISLIIENNSDCLDLAFNIGYKQYYPDVTELTGDSGSFVDNGGSQNDYSLDEESYWLIKSASGEQITLTFLSYSTEEDYDFMTIYDGIDDSASILLDQHSGDTIPGPFTSIGDSLFIKFTSDGSYTSSGWEALWEITNV